jgi:hypothetical protein
MITKHFGRTSGYYDYFVRVGQTLTTSWVTYNNNEIGGEFGAGKTDEYRKLCDISFQKNMLI